jgi:hypothetical protein
MAIFGSNPDGSVSVFGCGIYDGDFEPVEAVGQLAEMCKETKMKNPRITLDSGKVVYGCECWWGSEKAVKKELKGKQIVMVDIDEERKKFRKKSRKGKKQ